MKVGRNTCLSRIDSIIHHHCGNHEFCDRHHCKYKSIEFVTNLKHKVMITTVSDEEIKDEINKQYAGVSRFRGQTMDISIIGQTSMKKVISSRLSAANVDKLASVLSSNVCENYFGILVKFSQGKRLNLDQCDSWRVLQAFVAGLRSNPDFTSVVRDKAGVLPCIQRDLSMKRIHKLREQSQIFHKTEKQKQRRKVTKQVRAHLMGKDEKKSERHVTDKVKPLTASIKQSTA